MESPFARLGGQFGRHVGSWALFVTILADFWDYFGDFGSMLGTTWAALGPKGRPNVGKA